MARRHGMGRPRTRRRHCDFCRVVPGLRGHGVQHLVPEKRGIQDRRGSQVAEHVGPTSGHTKGLRTRVNPFDPIESVPRETLVFRAR